MSRDILEAINHVGRRLEHIVHHVEGFENRLESIQCKVDKLFPLLENLTRLGELTVAIGDDIKTALKTLDDETTKIGDNITVLVSKIKNGMTDAEVADVKAGFDALSARLVTLAVDPTVPVPPVPPALAALRKKI